MPDTTTKPTHAEKLAALSYDMDSNWSWTCPVPQSQDEDMTDDEFINWIDAKGEWFKTTKSSFE